MSGFPSMYSGVSLYQSNSYSHSSSFLGYLYPTGFHLVIERPDFVNLVNPPNCIITKITPAVESNQRLTKLLLKLAFIKGLISLLFLLKY